MRVHLCMCVLGGGGLVEVGVGVDRGVCKSFTSESVK